MGLHCIYLLYPSDSRMDLFNSLQAGKNFMLLSLSADLIFFQKKNFKKFFKKYFCGLLITFANNLDPDQDRHSVGPDLDLNCLQRLSADDKSQR